MRLPRTKTPIWIVFAVRFTVAIPGSPFAKGEQGVPEAVMQRLNEKYGLDQPLY